MAENVVTGKDTMKTLMRDITMLNLYVAVQFYRWFKLYFPLF